MYCYVIPGANSTPKRYLAHRATFSKAHTIKQVQSFLAYRLHLHYDNIRLWNYIDEVTQAIYHGWGPRPVIAKLWVTTPIGVTEHNLGCSSVIVTINGICAT